MDTNKIKTAIEFAKQNPDSQYAIELRKRIESGSLDNELHSSGYSQYATTPAPEAPKSMMEKVASFTGGEKIAQGIGQAIVNPEISKQQEQLLNDAIKQQGELLKKKKEITDLGGDTTHIDKGLEYNKQNLESISGGMEGLLNQNKLTTKQVVGDALQLGTTVAGVATLPGASKAVTATKTFGQGAIEGAKLGAKTGAIYGASSGVSGALKEDKGTSDIIKQGIGGAMTGAATGAALGGITGGITGKISGAKEAKIAKKNEFVTDLVSPNQTEKYKIQALKEGRVTEQGLLSAAKIAPSNRDIQLADAVKDVVDVKGSPMKNIGLIKDEITNINSGVKSYVSANKVPFNTKQLTTQLNKGKDELNLIFASDKQAEKTYNAVVKEFIKNVEKKDTSGLLDARQSFDSIPAIKKLLNSQGLGENAKREIVLTVRDMANRYTADLLPAGNKFREALLKESKMFEAFGNIAEKSPSLINNNKIQSFVTKYPFIKILIGGAAGAGVGAGGAIIASTD